jgi:cation transport regulator
MPYSSNNELPDRVKNNLPDHAQTIYRKAFNNAIKEYKEEDRAHKVAWAAVEKVYKKNKDGKWIKK